MSEKQRLEAEIKYYSELLKNSSRTISNRGKAINNPTNNPYKYKKSNIRDSSLVKAEHVVKNPELSINKSTIQSSSKPSNRIVVPPQNSKRTVIASTSTKPSQYTITQPAISYQNTHQNTHQITHKHRTNPHSIINPTSLTQNASSSNKTTTTQYKNGRLVTEPHRHKGPTHRNLKPSSEPNSKQATAVNPYKWIRKEILPKHTLSNSNQTQTFTEGTSVQSVTTTAVGKSLASQSNSTTSTKAAIHGNHRNSFKSTADDKPCTSVSTLNTSSENFSQNDKLVRKGKYKLVKSSIIEKQKTARKQKSELLRTNRKKKRFSEDGKQQLRVNIPARHKLINSKIKSPQNKIISRYKIRRRSRTSFHKQKQFNTTPRNLYKLNNVRHSKSLTNNPYKLTKHSPSRAVASRFKIDRRGQTTRSKSRTKSSCYTWVRGAGNSRSKLSAFVSPYKLVRRMSTESRMMAAKSDMKCNFVRQLASRALQRSAVTSLRVKYRKNNTNDKQCLFYMRFGLCKRGDTCRFEHNPDRIAVCTRYLRGTCTIENCKFSHEARKEKVPVCQHFLRGVCARENCPYLHVNVGKDAPICENFAQYKYCHLGEQCRKLHTDICPNRSNTGGCPRGKKCHLRHPIRMKKLRPLQNQPSETDRIKSDPVIPNGEKFSSPLPSYISLKRRKSSESGETSGFISGATKLKTKPSFLD